MHLTTRQAAEKLGIKIQAVRDLIRNQRIPAIKHGRDWMIDDNTIEGIILRKRGRPVERN